MKKYEENDIDPKLLQIQIITRWLDENPQINGCKDFDNLYFFLRNCKYDIEKTKKKIRNFYHMRAERNEWFYNRNPFLTEIQELLSIGVFLPIDGVDDENRKVVIIRTAAHDPKKHSQNNVFKVSKMILDILLKFEPDNCSSGIAAIFDMNGVQFSHAMQMTPKIIKRSVDSWQAYPCQPKLLEFVHAPKHVNIFLNTFRIFMTAKMRSRILVHRETTSIKCKNLPKELGGNAVTYQEMALKWKQIVEDNQAYFEEYDQYKSIFNR